MRVVGERGEVVGERGEVRKRTALGIFRRHYTRHVRGFHKNTHRHISGLCCNNV